MRLCSATLLLLVLASMSASTPGQEIPSVVPEFSTATDLEAPAGGINLRLQRKHVTGRSLNGSLGSRWRHNWESRLSRAVGEIQIEDWAGVTSFTQTGTGQEYLNASGERVMLATDGRATRSIATGGSETFDTAGRLVERTYRPGVTVSLRYDAQGRLSRIEGPAKGFFSFTSDSAGRVNRIDSSTGSTVSYTYVKDDLTEVEINGGSTLRYGYDGKGGLIRIEDPQTGAVDIAYDVQGRETSYRWADGSEQRFEYDDATKSKRVIAANGAVTVTREDVEKRRIEVTDPLGHKTTVQLDEAGRPVSVTGPTGASSHLSYDSLGRVISSEPTPGRATRYEYAADSSAVKAIIQPDGTRQEFDYDKDDNLSAIRIAGRTVSVLTYNRDGSIASAKEPGDTERKFTYFPNGLTKSVAAPLGEATQFEYDARGNLVRETNALGGVTIRSYDPQNRLVKITSPAGETVGYEYDNRGRIARETNSDGGITLFAYDARGRLSSETDPAGEATRYEYTPVDQVAKVIYSNGQTQTYRYDLTGNVTAQTDRLGRTTMFEYDPAGRLTRERSPSGLEVRYRYDAAGDLIAVEDSSGSKSEYQINAGGKITLRIDPAGGKTQYRYDRLGNLFTVTDPLGGARQLGYTADGDLAQVFEPSRDEARYEYDAAGRIVAIHRPSGGVTGFTYDSMGNLLSVTDPLGKVKRYTYDNAGRLLSFTDAANRVTRYAYDKAGRLTEKQLPEGKRVAYKYDALGRMIEADDGAFPVRRSYDQAGRLKDITYAAINKTVAYEYDDKGLRTKLLAPGGYSISYEYDALKRLSAVVLPDGKRIGISYDEKNRVRAVGYPNGLTGRWDYEPAGQIAKIAYQDAQGKTVAGSSYRYDLAGNPVERQDAQGAASRFAYDPAGQLIEESGSAGAVKYTYAAGGNRAGTQEGAQVRSYKYDAADQLIEAGADQLAYDANGNLISRKGAGGVTSYEYDAENRLIKTVAADGAAITFGYAPTGERVWRRDKNGVTYFLYDGFNLIAELSGDFRTRSSFVHGLGIDRPLAMLQEKQSYYYAADRVGTITHLIDDKGNIAASYTQDAFGKTKTQQRTIANPFAYTGRELDPTGLYYFRARYYDAELGRFLSRDLVAPPLDEPLEQNPYLYARNSPARFVDPLGLAWITPEILQNWTTEELKMLNRDPEVFGPSYDIVRNELVKRGAMAPEPPAGQAANAPAPRVNNPTGAVNGGSPNRAGANTGEVRPQAGRAGSNTRQVGDGPPKGNTVQVSGGPGAPPEKGFWTLDPSTIRPSIKGWGKVASVLTVLADCYRNGLQSAGCGGKIVGIAVVGGIVKAFPVAGKVLGKVSPIATLISGGKAWWDINKELNKAKVDREQLDAQAKARDAQAKVNLNNRDAFYPRIEQLRNRIIALRPHYETMINNTPKAQQQLKIAIIAAAGAENSLSSLGVSRNQIEDTGKLICAQLNQIQPGTIKTDIERLAAQAEARMRESDNLLNESRQLAANCRSAADANTIREKYKALKSIPTAIAGMKTEADRKNAGLEKLRGELQNMKGRMPAVVTTDIADKALAADNAAKEATKLVTQMRDAMQVITSEKSLRTEINALQAAVPESVLADIQDRFNELHTLLSSLPEYRPLERYDDEALDAAKRANAAKEAAVRILEKWSINLPCQTDVPAADAAIQRINTALTMAGLNDAGEFLRQAQICEANAKCLPVINQARELIERLQIEEGAAAINQARQQGCNVTGLENTLDYYRSIRDAAALLFNANEHCKFQEGLAFAQKMPASMQSNPWLANGIEELRSGLAAQAQIEQYIANATAAASKGSSIALKNDYAESRKLFAQADGFVAQAELLAKTYSCLADRVNKYKDGYNRLKESVNNNSGGQGATSSDSGSPIDEVPGALGSGKGKQPPTEELPGALGSGKGKQTPTDELPGALGSGKGKQTPTEDLPGALGSGKGKQTPTDELPGALGSGKGKQTPTEDLPGALGSTRGKPPTNPNDQSKTKPKDQSTEGETSKGSGACKLQGSWKQDTPGIGTTIWEITSDGNANEKGIGYAKGTAKLTGKVLHIDWKTDTAYSGYYEWTLEENCATGKGSLVFKTGRTDTLTSAVKRN